VAALSIFRGDGDSDSDVNRDINSLIIPIDQLASLVKRVERVDHQILGRRKRQGRRAGLCDNLWVAVLLLYDLRI
jgi:hypothetical protein